MSPYTSSHFGTTVRQNFEKRREVNAPLERRGGVVNASSGLEARSLGHPDFEDLMVGERRTAPMVSVFLDLTNFTGRSFWDDPDEVADLAHAVLTGFIEVVTLFGGYPLGLRGDGLFAGFSPGDPTFTAAMALGACSFALEAIISEINPWLERRGTAPVQARAGLDYGLTTFVRSGSPSRSEVNPIGFAANFAAKCEKKADSWEIVIGQGLAELLPDYPHFTEHSDSPKEYDRNYQKKFYTFYDYSWRASLPYLSGVIEELHGTPTSTITVG